MWYGRLSTKRLQTKKEKHRRNTYTQKEKNNRDLQGKTQAMQRGPEEEKRVSVRKEIISNWKEAFQTQERFTSIKRLTEYQRKNKGKGKNSNFKH